MESCYKKKREKARAFSCSLSNSPSYILVNHTKVQSFFWQENFNVSIWFVGKNQLLRIMICKWIFENDKVLEVYIEHKCICLGYIAKNHS